MLWRVRYRRSTLQTVLSGAADDYCASYRIGTGAVIVARGIVMEKVTILGAGGKLAQLVEPLLLEKGYGLIVVSHSSEDHKVPGDIKNNPNVKTIEGSTKDLETLRAAVKGASIVYANITGDDVKETAENLVKAMDAEGVRRVVWITTLDRFAKMTAPDEMAQWNDKTIGKVLVDYHEAAKVIENSDLDYTVICPTWLPQSDEIEFELSSKAENIKNLEVAAPSVADAVAAIAGDPNTNSRSTVDIESYVD